MESRRLKTHGNEFGFTLIEIAAVVLVLALLGTLAAQRVDSVLTWKHRSEIRRLANTWEFLFNQAFTRREPYRLVINLDEQTYQAFRETSVAGDTAQNVDRVEKFRLDSEKKRRAERERDRRERRRKNLEEEYAAEDQRQSGSLDGLFFDFLFNDSEADSTLSTPLEFPSLAEPVSFSDGVRVRDVRLASETVTAGEVGIRFSPRGASEFAVVHLESMDRVFTIFMNPSTGELQIVDREVDFEWQLGTNNESKFQ